MRKDFLTPSVFRNLEAFQSDVCAVSRAKRAQFDPVFRPSCVRPAIPWSGLGIHRLNQELYVKCDSRERVRTRSPAAQLAAVTRIRCISVDRQFMTNELAELLAFSNEVS